MIKFLFKFNKINVFIFWIAVAINSWSKKLKIKGKSWLKAAENCFQVSMKPLMSSSSNSKKKCKEQKGNVKEKKAKCYLNPGKGKPTLCSLECTDWYRIFWNLKNESDVFTLAEDLSQFLRLFKGCKEISRCAEDFYVPTVSYKFSFTSKKMLHSNKVNLGFFF